MLCATLLPYNKLSLGPSNLSVLSIRHAQDIRFISIRCEICTILRGNLLTHLANCYGHSVNHSSHLTNCCMHSTNYYMYSISCYVTRPVITNTYHEFTIFIDIVQLD
jgi:hypothetical protein